MLLKSALDIRKYNTDFQPKTPGMRPCVLYISMENSFTETIERVWNMTFDTSMTNYSEEQATEMLAEELGISKIYKDEVEVEIDGEKKLADLLELKRPAEKNPNIEIVLKYFPYREINTEDLYTIIQDLADDNMEVCAVVFDYIKRIRPAEVAADNVKLELNRIINELKALAVIKDIPVITAHQMNRAAAGIFDMAVRQGKGDAMKLVGREHVGDAWEIMETSDWVAILGIEYKPGTDERFMLINIVKRRRLDSNDKDLINHTFLAHPFAKNNGLRLIDDMGPNDKVLSLQSLVSDISPGSVEKANAVPRLKMMQPSEFVEFDDENYGDD